MSTFQRVRGGRRPQRQAADTVPEHLKGHGLWPLKKSLGYYMSYCEWLPASWDEEYDRYALYRWQTIPAFMDRYGLIRAGGYPHPGRLTGRSGYRGYPFACFPGEDHTIYWRRPGVRNPVVAVTCPYRIDRLPMLKYALAEGLRFEVDTEPSHWNPGTHFVAWHLAGVDWRQNSILAG